MRRWWFSSFIVISFVLLMSCGAVSEQPQKGEDLHSNDLQYYSQEDQKNIFWQNEASFDELKSVIADSAYNYLSFNQTSSGDLQWVRAAEDVSGIIQFETISSSEISQDIVCPFLNFYEAFHCRSIMWDGEDLIISFWDEWGNDGIIYTKRDITESEADYYTELGENWYYFAFPAV